MFKLKKNDDFIKKFSANMRHLRRTLISIERTIYSPLKCDDKELRAIIDDDCYFLTWSSNEVAKILKELIT